jgi:hypothetical protein
VSIKNYEKFFSYDVGIVNVLFHNDSLLLAESLEAGLCLNVGEFWMRIMQLSAAVFLAVTFSYFVFRVADQMKR